MSLREVYRVFGDDSEAGRTARRVLEQQNWFTTLADFDPKTGEALPLGLDEVMRRLNRRPEPTLMHDRLWRIAEHSRVAVEHLLDSLNESPRREQALLPIRAVREVNATSLIALNRRPGRNVREKLAGRPYMHAVRRYQSIDLPENRLLKVFAARLAELLELRHEYLRDEDTLLAVMQSWLRGDESARIGRWDNLPPNNTLLSHRAYRRVWDAWRWLQTLDDDIDRDIRRAAERAETVSEWEGHALDFREGTVGYGDMPVLFDYEEFTIRPWLAKLAQRAIPAAERPEVTRVVGAVCVDLTEPRPRYSTAGNVGRETGELYVWQRWARDGDIVDLELYGADFPILHPESVSIAVPDLFFQRDVDPGLADAAARSFARRLRWAYDDASLTWLIPDHLNEFQVEILRRNLNSRFPLAKPLPRSVAAVFAEIDYKQIKGEGFAVVVLDNSGGTTTATRLVARIDSDLAKRLPGSKGYYWERTPTVVVGESGEKFKSLSTVSHVEDNGQWWEGESREGVARITEKDLRARFDVGNFDKLLIVKDSPVTGGSRLNELEAAAGDMGLWRDHIPELSIKVIKDHRYQAFYLVGKKTTIRPVRGVGVAIPVREKFTLPAGKSHYRFPLFQGSDANDLGFEARIESPSFPLAHETACRIRMTYTYGVDDPYRLVFEPLDRSFPPVQVKWRPKSVEPVTDAPGPAYPTPLTWQELQSYYYAETGRTSDYPDWAVNQTERLLERIETPKQLDKGTVARPWRTDRNGKQFTFISVPHDDDVFLHENGLTPGSAWSSIHEGATVYFDMVAGKDGRSSARNASTSPVREKSLPDLVGSIRSALYVPYIKTWSDGRSIQDAACPTGLRRRIGPLAARLVGAMRLPEASADLRREILFLLCCMHRDMPEVVSRELLAGLDSPQIDERAYGFALGDLNEAWQQQILQQLLSVQTPRRLSVLAQAIWRSEAVIRFLDESAILSLSEQINDELWSLQQLVAPEKEAVSTITRLCELLLGLLRSRDSEVPGERSVLQPGQPVTQKLVNAVELSVAAVDRSGLPLRSRVQVGGMPDKPPGDHTPDLLYALRLYLTGDDGANAIRVTGVLDGDDQ
ncbi:DNA-binding protein [Microcella sp.]|uniref:DNA-binding protein n=1 Tax=Microcella sp. TaxID=1913979 RepID=UPI00391A314A